MKFLTNVGSSAKGLVLKAGAKVSKRSPEILLVCGAVTFVGTVVVACKQTLKCEEVLDKHERAMQDIENCLEMASEEPDKVDYTLEDAKKDRFIAYCHTGLGFARVYAPAFLLGTVSLVCFGCSYNILRKRNLALTIAYGAVEKAFKEYRSRVKEQLGEETDKYFRYGFKKVKGAVIEGRDSEGNRIAVKSDEEIDTVPWDEEKKGDGTLDNATFFFAPETSKYYFPDELHNDATISAAKNVAQVEYNMKGFLFLNEVLKDLGLPEVPYGQLVGWKKGLGDDEIDFRVQKVRRKASTDPNRNPLGLTYETVYVFDFNTCGIIWDKI